MPHRGDTLTMSATAIIGGLGLIVFVLFRLRMNQPEDIVGSSMSRDWQQHLAYQMTKPGGAQEPYLSLEEQFS